MSLIATWTLFTQYNHKRAHRSILYTTLCTTSNTPEVFEKKKKNRRRRKKKWNSGVTETTQRQNLKVTDDIDDDDGFFLLQHQAAKCIYVWKKKKLYFWFYFVGGRKDKTGDKLILSLRGNFLFHSFTIASHLSHADRREGKRRRGSDSRAMELVCVRTHMGASSVNDRHPNVLEHTSARNEIYSILFTLLCPFFFFLFYMSVFNHKFQLLLRYFYRLKTIIYLIYHGFYFLKYFFFLHISSESSVKTIIESLVFFIIRFFFFFFSNYFFSLYLFFFFLF